MKDYSLSHENDEQQKEEYQDSKDFHHKLSIRSHRLEVSKIKIEHLKTINSQHLNFFIIRSKCIN